jgi:TetR/AcrR family transcriptional regulator
MKIKDAQTEALIKDTAMRVFFEQGRLHATTQEIADEAGVNRSLIHYYFRSRDLLLEQVFIEGKVAMDQKIHGVLLENVDFKTKVSKFLDLFIERSLKYPYMETFMISQVNRKCESQQIAFRKDDSELKKRFLSEVEEEITKGNLKSQCPINFMIDLMSLCSYPVLSKPLIKNMFNFDEQNFTDFMSQRKKNILNLVFKE